MESLFAAIICAAGSSRRMGGAKKEYRPLPFANGKPVTVLGAAVRAFASIPGINPIIITVPPGGEEEARASLPDELFENVFRGGFSSARPEQDRVLFVSGGPTRRASVHNALRRLESEKPSHVLIHDGARPWITRDLIERVMEAAVRYGAVIPALPLVETPKEFSREKGFIVCEGFNTPPDQRPGNFIPTLAAGSLITRHLRREELCGAQTPQAFAFREILSAHEKAAEREKNEHYEYTDDAEVWGEFAGEVAVIAGEAANRKITFPEDLAASRPDAEEGAPKGGREREAALTQRIGLGKDLHRLAEGRRFLLGGAEIPFEKGEEGHSDGDVLSHAVCDALLGAAGLGDIGELFPPGDPAWKDADSLELLRSAWEMVRNKGWRLVNLDCAVTCERPKILPHRGRICRSLAQALDVDPSAIFVKGKTNEGLGPPGTGEAVEALAVCLIEKDAERDAR